MQNTLVTPLKLQACRKALVLFLAVMLSCFSVYTYTRVIGSSSKVQAATNSNLNFQGRIYQSNGTVVPDGLYNLQFKLYDGGTQGGPAGVGQANAGTQLWSESYYDSNGISAGNDNRVRVRNGYFSVNLGSQTAFPTTVDWSEELWITMNVGGATQTATPTYDGEMLSPGNTRTKLTGIPFAFQSSSAKKLIEKQSTFTGDLSWATLTQSRNILLPDADGTVLLNSTGFAQNGNSFGGTATLGTNDTNDLVFETNSLEAMRIDQSGDVSIGTGADGVEKLEVNGGIKLGNTTNTNAGTIRWTGTDFEGYDGGSWKSLTVGPNTYINGTTASFVSGLANVGANITGTAVETLVFTSATGVSNTAGVTGFTAPADGSFSTCLVKNNANITGGTLNLRWRVNGVSVGAGACTMNNGANNRQSSTALAPGTVTFNAGDTIGIAFDTVGLAPTTNDFTVYWSVNYEVGTSGGGISFAQGGNSFGGTASLGTNDNFGLEFKTNNSTVAGFNTSNTLTLGNGGASGTAATPNAFTIQGTGSSTAGTAGAGLSVVGGAGATTTTGSAGGGLILLGGNGGGSGNNNGGVVRLDGGSATGSGIGGSVSIADLNASALNLGRSGIITTVTGDFTQTGGALSLTGNAASTISTTAGNLTIQAGSGTVSLGTSTALSSTGALTVSSGGAGGLTLDSASNTLGIAASDTTLQRVAAGTFGIDLSDGANTTLNLTNSGAGLAGLTVEGNLSAGNGTFNVSSTGDITSSFVALNGTSTANGAGANSTSLVLANATNFDIGNYVQVNSANCGGAGINPCYAKITNKAVNTLTISPALSWANGSTVNEYHIPELGGQNTSQALTGRYGRGYFISGIATGNGTTYFNEDGIESSASIFNIMSGSTGTLNIGGGSTTLNLGGTVNVTGTLTGDASGLSNINAGSISGALSGLTTINASGAITAATAGDTINGLVINSGSLSSITGYSQTTGNFSFANNAGTFSIDSSAFDVSAAGAISGVTTINASGAITAATATNTINGLIINAGALSGVTGMTFTSGGINLNNGGITNAGTISGLTSIGTNGLISGTSGLTVSGGAVSINDSSNFATSINTGTSNAAVTIGGGNGTFALNSTAFDVSTAGALSGITTINASGAITAATAGNTINGLVISSGSLSSIAGFSQTTGNFSFANNAGTFSIDSSALDISAAGALSGITTIGASGAITAATATNTINGLVINAGSLSGITGYAQTSGNFSQTGTGTFSTGTGTVSLNGATNVATATNGATALNVTGTTGTAATALNINQGGNAANLTMTNTARTTGALVSLTQSTSAFTGTGLQLNMASGSGSFASGNFLDLQLNGVSRFRVDNTGALEITSDSTAGLNVENTAGVSYFSVNASGAQVRIGSAVADGVATLLIQDTKNTAGDPTGVNGGSYYNSAANQLRCYEGNAWKNCISNTLVPKAGTQTVTNSATFNNDTALFFPMLANNTYTFDAAINFSTTSAAADFKYTFTVPAGATVSISTVAPTGAAASTVCNITASGQTCTLASTANYRGTLMVTGYIFNGANAGNLQFQFAQNTQTAGQSVSIYQGSSLSWKRTSP